MRALSANPSTAKNQTNANKPTSKQLTKNKTRTTKNKQVKPIFINT
jgi:hypothetical protein